MTNLRTVYGGGAWFVAMLLVVGVTTGAAGQGTGTISGTIADASGACCRV